MLSPYYNQFPVTPNGCPQQDYTKVMVPQQQQSPCSDPNCYQQQMDPRMNLYAQKNKIDVITAENLAAISVEKSYCELRNKVDAEIDISTYKAELAEQRKDCTFLAEIDCDGMIYLVHRTIKCLLKTQVSSVSFSAEKLTCGISGEPEVLCIQQHSLANPKPPITIIYDAQIEKTFKKKFMIAGIDFNGSLSKRDFLCSLIAEFSRIAVERKVPTAYGWFDDGKGGYTRISSQNGQIWQEVIKNARL